MQTRVLRVLSGIEEGRSMSPAATDPLPTSRPRPHRLRLPPLARRARPGLVERERARRVDVHPTPGFAKPATIEEIAKHGHVLTPGRYVGAEEVEDDAEPFAEKYPRMVAELEECFAEGEHLTALVRSNLGRIADG